MSEPLIDHKIHKDPGALRLGLKARYSEMGAWEKIKAIRARIHSAYISADPNAQIFEEGPVLLAIPPRGERSGITGEVLGHASSWLMDFRSDKCARLHNHPLGERVLNILPDSHFQIWSASPIEISDDLRQSGIKVLPEDKDRVTGEVFYGIEVPPYTEFSVQIPKGTTHRFLGSGVAESFHPDELAEIKETGAGPDMEAQTRPWSETKPDATACVVGHAEKMNPANAHEELQRNAINRLSKRLLADSFITERDIFLQLNQAGNRVSLFNIHSALKRMRQAGSGDVEEVELMDKEAQEERFALTGIASHGRTKVLVLRASALDTFHDHFLSARVER